MSYSYFSAKMHPMELSGLRVLLCIVLQAVACLNLFSQIDGSSPAGDHSEKALPIVYVASGEGGMQPAFLDRNSKTVYLWNGVIIPRAALPTSIDASAINRWHVLFMGTQDLLGYSFSTYSPKPRYHEMEAGVYIRGYADFKNGVFFQSSNLKYSITQLSKEDIVKTIHNAQWPIVQISGIQ